MDPALLWIIAGIFLLILWSAFFSGSETALMAASRPRLHAMRKEGNKAARRAEKILDDPEKLLSTILLGNNLVNIGASALATGVFLQLFGDAGIAWATFVMTFLVLIFAEVLPKTIASRWPETVSMSVSLPLRALMMVLMPFTWFIRKITRFFMWMMRIRGEHGVNFGQEDLRGAIGMGLLYGVLGKGTHRMLDSVLDLTSLSVEDVMVHRSAIDSLDVSLSADQVFKQLALSPHSRLPVWENNSDNIIGTMHVKDFYRAYQDEKEGKAVFSLKNIISAPYFIPENVSIYDQMREFRKQRRHMAVVVDEYGDLQGLVTLEDLIEEIVGEIEDEHDASRPDYIQRPDGSVVALATFPVRDANRAFGWSLPEDDAVTLGGFLTQTVERIPLVGEKIVVGDLEFKVLAKKRQSIMKVRIRPAVRKAATEYGKVAK